MPVPGVSYETHCPMCRRRLTLATRINPFKRVRFCSRRCADDARDFLNALSAPTDKEI